MTISYCRFSFEIGVYTSGLMGRGRFDDDVDVSLAIISSIFRMMFTLPYSDASSGITSYFIPAPRGHWLCAWTLLLFDVWIPWQAIVCSVCLQYSQVKEFRDITLVFWQRSIKIGELSKFSFFFRTDSNCRTKSLTSSP